MFPLEFNFIESVPPLFFWDLYAGVSCTSDAEILWWFVRFPDTVCPIDNVLWILHYYLL